MRWLLERRPASCWRIVHSRPHWMFPLPDCIVYHVTAKAHPAVVALQVVSAMEAVGVMELLTKFNSKSQNPKVRHHSMSFLLIDCFLYVIARRTRAYACTSIYERAHGCRALSDKLI